MIETTSLSYEAIKADLDAWLDAKPDASAWQDFFESGAGTTLIEAISAMAAFLAFRIVAERRETYLQYAENRSSCIAGAKNLGYSVDRGTNKHLTITVTPSSTVSLSKYAIIGSAKNYDIVLAETTSFNSGVNVQIEVILGNKETEEIAVTSLDLQIFKFESLLVSEDFQVFLNETLLPISNETKDLLNDKYITITNAFGAMDLFYLNTGSYRYDSGDTLTLEYIELIDFDVVESDITFDYGELVSLDSTVAKQSPETVTAIKVNGPLYHETQLLIRGRDDYKKVFKQFNTSFVDTNGEDTSPAVVNLSYVLVVDDVLTLLTSDEKDDYISELSINRPFGVQPPTIEDPNEVNFELDVVVTLKSAIPTLVDINEIVAEAVGIYEKVLGTTVDLSGIEDALNEYSWVKVARITMHAEDWQSSTSYGRGACVLDTAGDGTVYYECTVAGTSASGEPSWDTMSGDTIDDNGIEWTKHLRDYNPGELAWNDYCLITSNITII